MGKASFDLSIENITILELDALKTKLSAFIQNNPNIKLTGFRYFE